MMAKRTKEVDHFINKVQKAENQCRRRVQLDQARLHVPLAACEARTQQATLQHRSTEMLRLEEDIFAGKETQETGFQRKK